MQHRYLTRFATILQDKLHVFVARTFDVKLPIARFKKA